MLSDRFAGINFVFSSANPEFHKSQATSKPSAPTASSDAEKIEEETEDEEEEEGEGEEEEAEEEEKEDKVKEEEKTGEGGKKAEGGEKNEEAKVLEEPLKAEKETSQQPRGVLCISATFHSRQHCSAVGYA